MTTRLMLCISSLLLLLAGCASAPPLPPLPPASDLFNDAAFKPPAEQPSTANLFKLSQPMRDYLRSPAFTSSMRNNGPVRGLVEALYKRGELRLEYDSADTRDAAQTYAARMGNCLSLVIMTAAFAKELGLTVDYQNVMMDQQWSRTGKLYISSTHVNLVLGARVEYLRSYTPGNNDMVIDFMPADEARRYVSHSLDEDTIVAMYLNNRAAEALAQERPDDAYWWARAAVVHKPDFITPYNTLGVIYSRHGDYAMAEKVYRRALVRAPEDTIVMHNLIPVLAQQGKADESKALAAQLASIQPTPPFHYFQLGMKAMEAEKYGEARDHFAREVKRSPYYHEFHFWLALAHWRLGESRLATFEMGKAIDTSTTTKSTALYTGKMAYLKSLANNRKLTY